MRYSGLMTNHVKTINKTVFVDRGPIPTATGIAHQLGWLEREAALDGTPLSVGGDDLWEGDSTRALWERSEGRATRLIGLTWIETFQAVVALPDAGIAGPEQLAGRRLGLPFTAALAIDVHRAAASRGLHAALGLAGIFPGEVAHVDVDASVALGEPYAAELEALTSGDVDAIFVAAPSAPPRPRASARRPSSTSAATSTRPCARAPRRRRRSSSTPSCSNASRTSSCGCSRCCCARAHGRSSTRRRRRELLALETGTSVRDVHAAHGPTGPTSCTSTSRWRKLDALQCAARLPRHARLPRAPGRPRRLDRPPPARRRARATGRRARRLGLIVASSPL